MFVGNDAVGEPIYSDGTCGSWTVHQHHDVPTVWSEAKDAERSRGQLKMTPDRKEVAEQ